jgi:hypothetical protein
MNITQKDDVILIVVLVKLPRLCVMAPPNLLGDGISFVCTVMLKDSLERVYQRTDRPRATRDNIPIFNHT